MVPATKGSPLINNLRICSAVSVVRVVVCVIVCVIALCSVLAVPEASGQDARPFPPENTFLVGIGALPGLGVQLGYVSPGRTYTREALLFGNVIPRNSGSGYVAVAIGGTVRIIGVGEALGFIRPKVYDLDVGVRLGPALVFEFDESRDDKNQRFNIAAEPFVRLSRKIRSNRTWFAEAGLIRPGIRIGLWLGLG